LLRKKPEAVPNWTKTSNAASLPDQAMEGWIVKSSEKVPGNIDSINHTGPRFVFCGTAPRTEDLYPGVLTQIVAAMCSRFGVWPGGRTTSCGNFAAKFQMQLEHVIKRR